MQQNLQNHWNKAYKINDTVQLGWHEDISTPTLELIKKTNLPKDATILNVGVGSSMIIDDLLRENYTNIIASDLSDESLKILKKRLSKKSKNVQFIVDDLTHSSKLKNLQNIDLWNDRAVLHFFVKKENQKKYFTLLKKVVKSKGFVILAEFSLKGAKKCCGLDVFRYTTEMLQEQLGNEFELKVSFNYTFINPTGGERPYIYTLFQRK